ncbi:DUF5658 family protein [Natronomonas marina]|uniref:DUF5658 family protein n=1 Tax=Natronomonas marina TaxID=2961939 RepID=UPI0020CA0E31|nr:DUF5658 family protein [Natronomonas marina]
MAEDDAVGTNGGVETVVERQHLLWIFAVLLYGVGDTVTTLWGLSTGGIAETGPVVAPFLETYGRYALVAVKLVVFVGFYLVWRLLRSPGRAAVPAALAVVGAAVSTWNLLVIAGQV